MSVEITIVGFNDIYPALLAVEQRAGAGIARKVLRRCSKVIHEEAKQRAPKDSGLMANRLKVRAAPRRRGRIGVEVRIGAEGFYKGKTFYGAFVHFGHRIGKRLAKAVLKHYGETRKFVPANPFMEDALQAKGPGLAAEIPKMFWDEIAKVATSAAKVKQTL